jgi:hypothetical protein
MTFKPALQDEPFHKTVLCATPSNLKACQNMSVQPELTLKDAKELYETGKHRRYGLLFSVNGGAFAIAKLITGESGKPGVVLGNLTLTELSVGMVAFTAVMICDIYAFGDKMRKTFLENDFGWQGKAVLLVLGVLLCLGWLLVGL